MSQFATRFKHHQHTENITDDDECPIHLFNYPWLHVAGPEVHEVFETLNKTGDDYATALKELDASSKHKRTSHLNATCLDKPPKNPHKRWKCTSVDTND